MTRRASLLAILALLPATGLAQTSPTQPAARPRPRARRRAQPAPQAEAPAPPAPRDAPAPVPNRDLEGPRAPVARSSPRLNPALIDPNEPRFGATADPHSPQAREDRLLRNPGAGARLSVPFSY
ncbi:hypothetical protein [Neoroseomonas oryzicola]|uniref:Translation initiation factor IF-2 n=2 Tax=Neoroseomonas oryzicola TaxID=535904 RepID=A0ABX1EGI2_9PROT|nr:hypothetical protein [Neoroseomonas oryzicola]NKE16901.1 hypothetical protein [Neoroseomonas oryzicola]